MVVVALGIGLLQPAPGIEITESLEQFLVTFVGSDLEGELILFEDFASGQDILIDMYVIMLEMPVADIGVSGERWYDIEIAGIKVMDAILHLYLRVPVSNIIEPGKRAGYILPVPVTVMNRISHIEDKKPKVINRIIHGVSSLSVAI